MHLDFYQHKTLILLEQRSELFEVKGRRRLVDVSVREAKMKFWCILLTRKYQQEYLETGSPSQSPYASTTCSTFPILPRAPEICFHVCFLEQSFTRGTYNETICCNLLLSVFTQTHNLLRPGMRLRTRGSWESSTPAIERKFPNQDVEATFIMRGWPRH